VRFVLVQIGWTLFALAALVALGAAIVFIGHAAAPAYVPG
jgi:hypothetical protein